MATSSSPDTGNGSEGRGPTPAERIIARFGGIRPMANKLDLAVSTVQGWKERGRIPENRRAEIRDVARALDIAIDEAELRAATGDGAAAAAIDAESPEVGVVTPAAPVVEGKAERASEDGGEADDRTDAEPKDGPDQPPHAHTQSAAPPPLPPRRGWGLLFAGAVAGAVLGAAAAAGLWFLMPQIHPAGQPQDEVSDRIAALEDRLDRTQERIDTVGADIQQALSEDRAPEELRSELDSMREEFSDLDSKLQATTERLDRTDVGALTGEIEALREAQSDMQDTLDGLGSRVDDNATATEVVDDLRSDLDTLREEVRTLSGRVGAASGSGPEDRERQRNTGLLVALGQLRTTVETGEPYAAQLDALRSVLGEQPEAPWPTHIETLAAHADTGVARMEDLRRRFPAMAGNVLAVAGLPADADWLDRALVELEGVITVRRVGADIDGHSAEAILARAEAAIERGKVALAVEEMQALQGTAAEAAAPWLADARTLRAALGAADALHMHLVAQLAQTQSPGPAE